MFVPHLSGHIYPHPYSFSAAFSPVQIPICVDYFHHQCYGEAEFDIYDPALTARIMKVWQDRGMKPKCHISEQVSLQKFQSLIPPGCTLSMWCFLAKFSSGADSSGEVEWSSSTAW